MQNSIICVTIYERTFVGSEYCDNNIKSISYFVDESVLW